MSQFQVLVTTLVLFLSSVFAFAQSDVLIWNGNSDELVELIKSKDENKQVFALQKIITYPELVNDNSIAYDIYNIYRTHKNDKIRQMALVALFRMKHYNLLKNLKDDFYNEKNPEIRNQIWFILEKMPVLKELD
jgi:hypothetical protein